MATTHTFGFNPQELESKLDDVQGDNFNSDIDSLHSIKQDAGQLNDSIVIDGLIVEDTVLTGKTFYNNLTIAMEAELDGTGQEIYVFGDLTITNGMINAEFLHIDGNINVQRKTGDASYTNIFDVNRLECNGDVTLKNTDCCGIPMTWDSAEVLPTYISNEGWIINGNVNMQDVIHLIQASGSNVAVEQDFYSTFVPINIKGSAIFNNVEFDGSSSIIYGGGGWSPPPAGGLNLQIDGDAEFIGTTSNNILMKGSYNADGGAIYKSSGGSGVLSIGGQLTIDNMSIDVLGNTVFSTPTRNGHFNIYYGTLVGSFGTLTTNVVDEGVGTKYTKHVPKYPTTVTADDIIISSGETITWNVPVDENDNTLHFQIQIEEKFSAKFWDTTQDKISGVDSGFSGTAPYTEGTGTVSFTVDNLNDGIMYRWRIRAVKSTNSNDLSCWGPYKYFTYNA